MYFPSIEEVLPHQGSALWLTDIVSVEGAECVCEGALPVWTSGTAHNPCLGLELVAQGAAVYAGLHGGGKKVGYVASVQRATFDGDLPVGSTILVRVRKTGAVGRAAAFTGELWLGPRQVLGCEMLLVEAPGAVA